MKILIYGEEEKDKIEELLNYLIDSAGLSTIIMSMVEPSASDIMDLAEDYGLEIEGYLPHDMSTSARKLLNNKMILEGKPELLLAYSINPVTKDALEKSETMVAYSMIKDD